MFLMGAYCRCGMYWQVVFNGIVLYELDAVYVFNEGRGYSEAVVMVMVLAAMRAISGRSFTCMLSPVHISAFHALCCNAGGVLFFYLILFFPVFY